MERASWVRREKVWVGFFIGWNLLEWNKVVDRGGILIYRMSFLV